MIWETPKKLVKFIATHCAMTPRRLFHARSESTFLTEPPKMPDIDPDLLQRRRGFQPTKKLHERARGRNRSWLVRAREAHIAYGTYLKRADRWARQQAKVGPTTDQPVPLKTLQGQAQEQLRNSANREDQIFLDQLNKLNAQESDFCNLESLEEQADILEEERARLRHPPSRSFALFQQEKRAIQARKANQKIRDFERYQRGLFRTEESRKEESRKTREADVMECDDKEAGWRKVWENKHRAEIEDCLRRNQPLPQYVLGREALIREVRANIEQEEQVALQRRIQEAAIQRQAEVERQHRLMEESIRQRALEEQRRLAELEVRRQQREELARQQAAEASRHQAELERQRRAQEQAARRQAEEARRQAEQARFEEEVRHRAQEEARRQAEDAERSRFAQEQAQRAAQQQQPAPATNPFELYDEKWKLLKGAERITDITFYQFPWPVQQGIANPMMLTEETVGHFFISRGTAGKKTMRDMLKAEILKWHPDKFAQHLDKILPDQREAVREAGELVAKFLNNLMERY